MKETSSHSKNTTERLRSIDALRGSDMFFIMGGDGIFIALAALFPGCAALQTIADQMNHVAWHGFHFMDLVFPLFLFIAGVTFPFSLSSQRKRGRTDAQISLRCIRRALMLVILGLVYNGILSCTDFSEFRYASVLARIGLAWMCASLINIWGGHRASLAAIPVLLLLYWALLVLFPVHGMDPYSIDGSLVGRIDRAWLPGRFYEGIHDPEGYLGLITATVTALLGVEAGRILRHKQSRGQIRALALLIIGVVCLLLSLLWNTVMPINKNLWTSSFVLMAGGYSFTLLSVFYYVIDVLGWHRWSLIPAVIGMNSITIYIAQELISFSHTSHALFGMVISFAPEQWQPLLNSCAYVTTCWLFLYLLYRLKIFLKV